LKVAPYYGCLLLRPPAEIGLDDPDQPVILADLLAALGAEPVDFPFKCECCGSYLAVNKPDVPTALSGTIVESAAKHGAQAIVTACPLCQYNLDIKHTLPVVYFTEVIAAALGLGQLSITNFQ
jgi:heterodisulfide reductase subunit B